MEEAHKKCCAVYGDWKEFAAGYVIGRCMWGGMKQMPGGIMGIAEGLLRDPESPWQKYSCMYLKCKGEYLWVWK